MDIGVANKIMEIKLLPDNFDDDLMGIIIMNIFIIILKNFCFISKKMVKFIKLYYRYFQN